MGYALLSARKILLTSRINSLNFQIMCLGEQMQANANTLSNMQRLMNASNNWNSIMNMWNNLSQIGNGNYAGYLSNMMGGCNGYGNMLGSYGNMMGNSGCGSCGSSMLSGLMGGLMGGLFGNSYSSPIIDNNWQQLFWPYAQMSMIDDDIECQKKQLETQLKVAEKELEAVEKAEESAIGRATPKYA